MSSHTLQGPTLLAWSFAVLFAVPVASRAKTNIERSAYGLRHTRNNRRVSLVAKRSCSCSCSSSSSLGWPSLARHRLARWSEPMANEKRRCTGNKGRAIQEPTKRLLWTWQGNWPRERVLRLPLSSLMRRCYVALGCVTGCHVALLRHSSGASARTGAGVAF